MKYIIDGYNVIRSSPLRKLERKSIERGIGGLVEILLKYKRNHPSISFTVVFDGFDVNSIFNFRDKTIKILFSGQMSADEKIRRLLEKNKDNREIGVVSDDREVQTATKILGAKVISVEEFLKIVSFQGKRKKVIKKDKNLDYSKIKKIEEELRKVYAEKFK